MPIPPLPLWENAIGQWVPGFIPIRRVIIRDTIPGIGVFRNLNFQAPNPKEIPNSNDPNRFVILNFGHCDLFVICDLEFSPKLKRFLFD
jgi:hypothetical protein